MKEDGMLLAVSLVFLFLDENKNPDFAIPPIEFIYIIRLKFN